MTTSCKSEQQTVDLPRSLQSELRRVGCHTGSIDSNWNAASQRSLDLFNKHAGMKLDVKVASVDALDAVRSKPSRICPLICDHGFKADGDRCAKISCEAGYHINDANECERPQQRAKPQAKGGEKQIQDKPKPASGSESRSGDGSGAAAAAAGGGCSYEACLARCIRNTGGGSGCSPYCSSVLRNFALTRRCAL